MPNLIKMPENGERFVANDVIRALGELKAPCVVRLAAVRLKDIRYRDAAAALRSIGRAAESALIEIAPKADPQLCLLAGNLLGDVGRPKCFDVLRKGMHSRNPEVQQASKKRDGQDQRPKGRRQTGQLKNRGERPESPNAHRFGVRLQSFFRISGTCNMTYWTNLFTPETYEAFSRSDRTASGFRESQKNMAARVCPGDRFVCYMVRMSRWIGVLEVMDGLYIERSPLFLPEDDPFIVRFKVRTDVWLPLEQTVPIHEREVYSNLSFTRNVKPGGYWLGPLRRSLQRLEHADGAYLDSMLRRQADEGRQFPIDRQQYDNALNRRILRPEGSTIVSVPNDALEEAPDFQLGTSDRESIRIQAQLCRIGEAMGLKMWLPTNDRSRVLEHWHPQPGVLLERLPLNYDETTLDTIKRIDVLWLKGRTIRRAFEVEHSTAIYSGLLRMADLCALLPNINIALHIVAPEARREKVFQEITRPVFSLLEHSPLSKRCTYLSYGSVQEMSELEFLTHTTDSVFDEFVEYAE